MAVLLKGLFGKNGFSGAVKQKEELEGQGGGKGLKCG